MLLTEYLKVICAAKGIDVDTLPDNLLSTQLTAIAASLGVDVDSFDVKTIGEILEEIKANAGGSGGGTGGEEWIGDGKTHLWIKIATEGRMDVPLTFSQTVARGVTIDWGDGSDTETRSGTGVKTITHTYAKIGEYVISLDVADGCTLDLGGSSFNNVVLGTSKTVDRAYSNMLQKVEIGNGATSIGDYTFQYCSSLRSVLIPRGVTSIGEYAFAYCNSLGSIVLPESVTSIGKYAFSSCHSLGSIVIPEGVTSITDSMCNNCSALASIVIPEGVTSIGSSAFYSNKAIASIVIPASVMSIGGNAFYGFQSVKSFDFTKHTAVPTLAATTAFNSIPSDCEIRVPAVLYDEWIAATNWSAKASNIVAV